MDINDSSKRDLILYFFPSSYAHTQKNETWNSIENLYSMMCQRPLGFKYHDLRVVCHINSNLFTFLSVPYTGQEIHTMPYTIPQCITGKKYGYCGSWCTGVIWYIVMDRV